MRMLSIQTLRRGLSLLLLAAALTACGPDQSQSGPVVYTGSITLSRTTQTIVTGTPVPGACVGIDAGATFNLVGPFLISVFDEKGQPVGNADIQITLELAPNTTFGGTPTTQLVDGGVTVTNVGMPAPYDTTTDDDGTKEVFIAFENTTGCQYAGVMTVTSGHLFVELQFQTSES